MVDTSSASLPSNLSLYRYKRTNKCYTEDLGNGVKLTLMLIPAGEFLMGAPESEPESLDNERPQHRVKVAQFLMGRFPVTQAQWRVVAGYAPAGKELDPAPFSFKGDNRPVEKVSWEDAQEFCQRLSRETGKDYRLPSEAQWEYACRASPIQTSGTPGSGEVRRAGTETPFHFGETITTKLANYRGTSTYNNGPKGEYRGKTTEVGSFPANDWGLCDMHGNVWEWCEDAWHGDYKGAPDDGSAWVESDRTKTDRVLRGGSWVGAPGDCRSAYRDAFSRDLRYVNFGFRVCCVPPGLFLSS